MPFEFDEIEDDLDLVVPDVYRMFTEAVESLGLDLERDRIYHDTQSVIAGNLRRRLDLEAVDPPWKPEYFDIGVGDGCGNYFFLHANDPDDDLVELWAHDPPGIEDISTATVFLQELLAELKSGFQGPNKNRFAGSRYWD